MPILIQGVSNLLYFSSIYKVDTLWMLSLKYKINFSPLLVSLTYRVYLVCLGVNKLSGVLEIMLNLLRNQTYFFARSFPFVGINNILATLRLLGRFQADILTVGWNLFLPQIWGNVIPSNTQLIPALSNHKNAISLLLLFYCPICTKRLPSVNALVFA